MKKISFIILSLLLLSACNSDSAQQKNTQNEPPQQNSQTGDDTTDKTKKFERIKFVESPEYTLNELANFGIDVEKTIPTGLKAGDQVPDFKATDNHGNEIHLYEILKEKPVVLFFYRGNWCPVCNNYMVQFQESVGRIIERGAQVIAVAPESPDNVTLMVQEKGLSFPVISDKGYTIIDKFKVGYYLTDDVLKKIQTALKINLAEHNNATEAKLPVPATFIISQQGKVVKAFFNADQKIRASVEQIDRVLEN